MDIKKISASAIKTFETCPKKFYTEYVLKKRPPTHPAAAMGSCLHKMFEESCKAVVQSKSVAKKVGTSIQVDPSLMDPFHWMDAGVKEFNVSDEYVEIIRTLTNRCIEWGYMNLDHAQGFELEARFKLPCGLEVHGYIDRLDITPDLKADIIDLKTQKDPFTQEELDDNWQALIYFLSVMNDHPMVIGDVDVSFWVLRHKIQRVSIPQSRFQEFLEKLNAKTEEILKHDGDECRPSGLCRFCIADCVHRRAALKLAKTFDRKDMSSDVKDVKALLAKLRGGRKETMDEGVSAF